MTSIESDIDKIKRDLLDLRTLVEPLFDVPITCVMIEDSVNTVLKSIKVIDNEFAQTLSKLCKSFEELQENKKRVQEQMNSIKAQVKILKILKKELPKIPNTGDVAVST